MLKVLEGHKGAVFAVEMDDTTERIFSGSRDNVSCIFEAKLKIIFSDLIVALVLDCEGVAGWVWTVHEIHEG